MADDGVHDGAGVVGATVTTALPLFPSLVATIVAVPAAIPVTRPDVVTVAFVGSELDHSTARPASVAPFASRVVAVSCTADPTTSDAVAGVTETLATATDVDAVTVIAADPVFPLAVAMICAVPTPTAVTAPDCVTATTLVLEELHDTDPVAITAPF
jgi:hypothetical protein